MLGKTDEYYFVKEILVLKWIMRAYFLVRKLKSFIFNMRQDIAIRITWAWPPFIYQAWLFILLGGKIRNFFYPMNFIFWRRRSMKMFIKISIIRCTSFSRSYNCFLLKVLILGTGISILSFPYKMILPQKRFFQRRHWHGNALN